MILKNWSVFERGEGWFPPELRQFSLNGNVYGHPRFNDGDHVHTSSIVGIDDKGDHKEVTTRSGSVYCLYAADVNPKAEEKFPGYYKRLSMITIGEKE